MSDWCGDNELNWRALSPFGIEMDHDLAQPLTARQVDRIVQLLWQHGLICARGQRLTMERQQELCRLFGPVLIRPGETGYLSTEAGNSASLSELSWHSDAAYTNAPFDAIALHAVDVVDGASSTCFVSAERALDDLPAPLRQCLEGRRAEMISPAYDALAGWTCDRPNPTAQKRGEQSAIDVNPHNGRAYIRVGALQAARLLDMGWEESRALLHDVYDHMYRPAEILEHSWHNGDFVVWDNIALQHMRGPLNECGKRVLQRVIVGTEGVAPHIPLANSATS